MQLVILVSVLLITTVLAGSIPISMASGLWIPDTEAGVYDYDHTFNAITFDPTPKFDGWSDIHGCQYMIRGVDTDIGTDDDIDFLVSQGLGFVSVLHGEQTPQASRICSYGENTYFIGDYDYVATGSYANYWGTDPFTGLKYHGFLYTATTPLSSNPFEYSGFGYVNTLPQYSIIRTDVANYSLDVYLDGALVTSSQYMPLDNKIKFRIEGIIGPTVTLNRIESSLFVCPAWDVVCDVSQITPNLRGPLFDFDVQKYDGNVLVNGELMPVSYDRIPIYDIDGRVNIVNGQVTPVSYDQRFTITINMTEQGWLQLSNDDLLNKADKWYTQMYDQQYMDMYGEIPTVDHNHYKIHNKINNNSPREHYENLITYHDAVLDVEIPLIVHDKELHYTGSHPDIGWCRSPLILVAKSSSDAPAAACVKPNTASILIERGWAQEIPVISEQTHELLRNRTAGHGLQYNPGNADPVDAFIAALHGIPHVDDVRVLKTIPGVSYREQDFIRFSGGDKEDIRERLAEVNAILLSTEPECRSWVWNSPEPKDERIISKKCKR